MDPIVILADRDAFHRLLRQAAAQAGAELLVKISKAGGGRV